MSDTSRHAPPLTRIYESTYFGQASHIRVEGRPVFWSTPQLIFEATEVVWRGGRGPAALVDRRGNIHLAFALWGEQQGLVHLVQRLAHVLQLTEFSAPPAGYPAIALGPDSEMYLGYVAGGGTMQHEDVNSVFLRRSQDGGRSWGPPRLVSRSGSQQAQDVQIAIGRGDTIHMMWLKNRTGGYVPDAVWHELSADHGQTWSRPREFSINGETPEAVRLVADGDGGIDAIMVFRRAGSTGGSLYFVRWTEGNWGSLCAVDPGHNGMDPALAADGRGRVEVIWNRVSGGAEVAPRAVAVRAVLFPANPRH